MKKTRIILIIPLLLLTSVLTPALIQQAHAATGLVCLADPSNIGSATPCPASPPTFDGPKGQQIRIGVFIQGSDALNGFDIILTANPTYLVPSSVDLTDTVLLGTPTVIIECLQGILIHGSVCSAEDNATTLHYTVTGGLGLITNPPTTGLLFTAIYNITGTTAGSVPVTFAGPTKAVPAGCGTSSVAGGVCVTIANGSTTPDSETVRSAAFSNSNSATMASATLSANPSRFGPEFPGVNTATITARALNGYPGFATDGVSFSTTQTLGLTATLGAASCLTGGTNCNVTLTLSTANAGNYFVTVSGAYSTLDPSSNPDTLVSTVTLSVVVDDFGFSVGPPNISFASGSSGTATMTVASLNGFTGSVAFSTGNVVPTSPPLTMAFSPSTVTLAKGQILNATASFTASPTVTTTYHAIIKASSGIRVKNSPTLTVLVTAGAGPDFSLSANPSSIAISSGSAGTSTIKVAPLNAFAGTVTLSVTYPQALACTLSSVQIATSGTTTLTCSGSSPGTYGATVTGASGTLVHNVNVTITVLASTPGAGTVCIAGTSASFCPVSPPVIPGPAPTSSFMVAVMIDSSQALNGFDITIVTNSSVLRPAGVILGSVLSFPHDIVKCIGGVNKLGTTACPSTDTAGTIEYAVVGDVTTQPVTGLLFSANFTVLANTSKTPIGFQTGCTSTSVPSGICVSISNGSTSLVSENVQAASFSNTPYFNLTPLTNHIGRFSLNDTIDVSSLNGFTGTISLTATSFPSGPIVTLSRIAVTVSPGLDQFVVLNVTLPNGTKAGTYTLVVTGTSGTLPPNSMTVSLTVQGGDFTISLIPSSLAVNVGSNATATIELLSLAGFRGPVVLSAFTSTIGINLAIIPFNVTFPGNTVIVNSTLLVSASSTIAVGVYTVAVTGTSGTLTHSATLTVTVGAPTFVISAIPGFVTVTPGGSTTSTIYVTSLQGFIGSVTLSATVRPTGPTVSLNPTVLSLPSDGTLSSTATISVAAAVAPGIYNATVTATSGSLTRIVDIVILVPAPDFTMTTNTSFLTIQAGQNASATLNLSSFGGFKGTIALSYSVVPVFNETAPSIVIAPSSVTLSSGGSATAALTITTSRATPAISYTVTITGTSGSISHTNIVTVQVLPPPDIPPVASFTVSPANPIVGQSVFFDGSSSHDPDGSVVQWVWNFGDGNGFFCCISTIYHTYTSTGNYTVTLTVTDNAGLTGTTHMIVNVRPQPAHDVSVIFVTLEFTKAVATTREGIAVQVRNDGLNNETVSVTAYSNGRPVQTVNDIFLPSCIASGYPVFCYYPYVILYWDTTGVVPGNYTISASVSLPHGETDPTPSDNSLTDGTVTLLPSPVLSVSPSAGPTGTLVTVQGNGFLFNGPFWVTFDDMFLGEAFNAQNGTFTFTFDVPLAQQGIHTVKALDPYTGAHGSTTFTVTATQTGSLTVTVNTGSVYFPGDTVVVYVYTSLNGVPTGPPNVEVTVQLVFSNGTSRNLTLTSLAIGLFKATYTVPQIGPLGTYALVARAHIPIGSIDASSLASFEVKLSWLSSNRNNVITATTLAGVIGLVGFAWKRGYLRRKDASSQFLD